MAKERFRIVAIDETEHWNQSILDDYEIEAAFGLYLVREGEITHCCSFQADAWAEAICNAFIATTVEAHDRMSDAGLDHDGLEDGYYSYSSIWNGDARFRSESAIIINVDARQFKGGLRSDEYHKAIWDEAREEANSNGGAYEPPILNPGKYQGWVAEQQAKRRNENRPVLAGEFRGEQLPLFVAAVHRDNLDGDSAAALGWL